MMSLCLQMDFVHVYLSALVEFSNQLPSAISLDTGSCLSLMCNATGFPPPNVTWVKDGHSLTKGLTNQTGMSHSS